MIRWALYVVSVGFAVYWASNLLLWFPWSYSQVLGMTLMLTVAPVLWAYVVFLCLKTYPGQDLRKGALKIAAILLVLAVAMDFVFFGFVRNAMQELLHPTTFYAYGFLVCLPIILAWLLRHKIRQGATPIVSTDFIAAGISGLVCLGTLSSIIVFGIEI